MPLDTHTHTQIMEIEENIQLFSLYFGGFMRCLWKKYIIIKSRWHVEFYNFAVQKCHFFIFLLCIFR